MRWSRQRCYSTSTGPRAGCANRSPPPSIARNCPNSSSRWWSGQKRDPEMNPRPFANRPRVHFSFVRAIQYFRVSAVTSFPAGSFTTPGEIHMRRIAIALLGLAVIAGPLKADDAKAILEKAIKAHGGEEKLTKLKATQMKGKGTLSAMGMDVEFTIAISAQLPNMMRSELGLSIMGQDLKIVRVYNGKDGWMSAMGAVMKLEGDQLDEMKEEAFDAFIESMVPLLKDKQFKLESTGETKVLDKPAVGVKVSS